MNKKVLHTLEFDKITKKLSEFASCEEARQRCENLLPQTDQAVIEEGVKTAFDALSRLYRKTDISFSGVHNIAGALKRLEIGGSLNTSELLRIASLLEAVGRAKAYNRTEREEELNDSLSPLFSQLQPLSPLKEEIRRCILSEDEIADDASSTLLKIRKSIGGMSDRIHAQLQKLMNQSTTRSYLQDAVVTMRDGRYCLPVKAEAKSQMPGMVHDQSSSGSTIFIEPMAVVNLNNELKELYLKEEEEIELILKSLSVQVSGYTEALLSDYQLMAELDFIFAKASYAKEYNGMAPTFNTRGYIHIRQGRHPLLDPRKVVPIDVTLGDSYKQLIVTGPNTGGKTVSLKTVGLLTLMGQAGMLIPAADRSELSVFTEVFADIGDEQSIEQSLSTFSSHMTNIVRILDKADSDSLCLFDELCAGTDPTEGAALAISILNRLHNYGALTMATTHYSELKVYALTTDGVENACCEFNVETLSPTYRLLVGIPGKSNAFAISQKLGLDSGLIEDAKTRLSDSDIQFEDLLTDLETSRATIEREREEIARQKAEIESLQKAAASKVEKLDDSKDRILREANEEAYRILKEAKEVADQTIRNINKYGQAQAPVSQLEKERTKLRDHMTEKEKKLALKAKTAQTNPNAPKKLRIGDSVKVLSMNLRGTVHSLPDAKGNLFVQMGILKSQVNINDLILCNEEASPLKKKYGGGGSKIKASKSAYVSTEINLIGSTVDEAIAKLDKYLDDAYLAHLPTVRIVHGKGTGALRKAVHSHLKGLSYVKEFHLGEFGEGDAGVTICEFK